MKLWVFVYGLTNLFVAGNASWIRGYDIGDFSIGNSVVQTYDNGYIVTGGYMPTIFDCANLFLLKTDVLGDTQWVKTYGGGLNDEGHCIQQTLDSGYIAVGFANVDSSGMWPMGDIWLLRIDDMGDTLWTKLYQGSSSTEACWVEQTSDGGFIVTSNWNSAYLLLLKTDKDGNTVWSKNYQWGEKIEVGYCVRQTNDGGYIVATNYGLFKTDSKGDSVWLKPWVGKSVEQTSANGYILASEYNNDIWLIKTNDKGDTLWTKTYGGDSVDLSCEVHETNKGGYVIIGASGSFGGIWLLNTNVNGDTNWTRIIKVGGVSSGQQTTDGGYIITGETSLFGEALCAVLLIKTDSLGYVGIEETIAKPAQTAWHVISPVGSTVTLRYSNLPQGFHAFVFDASGRKVDEIQAQGESGTITWGQGVSTGVYFIKTNSPNILATKVVLLP